MADREVEVDVSVLVLMLSIRCLLRARSKTESGVPSESGSGEEVVDGSLFSFPSRQDLARVAGIRVGVPAVDEERVILDGE